MKATGDTPTVATQEGPAKVKLPPFQAFDVSSGDTVRPVLIRHHICVAKPVLLLLLLLRM